MSAPNIFYALFHSPGPGWAADLGFREQPGVGEHIGYMGGLMEAGQLLFGGPFLDDSGGMMVLRAPDLDSARAIAEADPTVINGLLQVAVKPWLMAMDSFATE